ncbi:LytR/AlgR family response regulator transcription factor [Chitinophagaceae bacterium MMS25-I14]
MNQNSITCIIIDDEPKAIELLQDSLYLLDKRIFVTATYATWEEALSGIRSHNCDIIFLDISIQGRNGMDLLRMMPEINSEIIFVTAHSDYALNAFKFPTAGYLLKPVDDVELAITLNRTIERILAKKMSAVKSQGGMINNKIGIPDNKSINYVLISDILYLEAQNTYTRVVTKDTEIISAYNLGKFRELLPEDLFYQVHRSFIVNLDCIRRYENIGTVILNNGKEIPVAQKNRAALLNIFARIKTGEGEK